MTVLVKLLMLQCGSGGGWVWRSLSVCDMDVRRVLTSHGGFIGWWVTKMVRSPANFNCFTQQPMPAQQLCGFFWTAGFANHDCTANNG
jgi:hypothetical protein